MSRLRPLLLGLLVLTGIWLARPASALTLVPPSLEFPADPGVTLEATVKLFNETERTVNVTTSTANFGPKGETGEPEFAFDTPNANLATWIKPSLEQFELASRETVEVKIRIEVPANAEPGGHYAGLFFGTGAPDTDEGGQVAIESKLGTLVILRVSGNIREAGSVEQFSIGTGTKSRLPIDLVLRIRNTGNVHFRPKGFVTIRNMWGGVSATIPFNPKEGAVLPNSIRRFDLSWERNPGAEKRGNFFQEVGREMRNFGLGTYSADVVINYGVDNRTMSETTKFTIFPWRFLLVLVLVIALIIFLLVWGTRRYNRMIIRRAQGSTTSRPPAPPKV